ncbi:hypothetical protein BDA96_02G204500 [Sorghum bicolor]|uniref:Uncharacterized protein n=2 Tax=Sorghum bicolor TaxID=4558 RepID=C5XC41_SORBI|nr:uncharacterized protein LOC8055794 [Sorghum bicolor]XP_021307815.1 uncharacterized protein LOC8055794 [Sorghum bicolor]EER98864.1 hypothetical protein SORBI_3002G194300 [Sorghum bicolor]KAG0543620.1 hypothetical protein BDA96_02G204500 [Sorghum bicolor]|eukprot:XP_002462343.1 uncharacterized protein LOC8055794 [Sorghum bicolor]
MDEPADAGAVASSTSSSSLSSPDEDAFQDQLAGHGALAPPPAADVAVAQPVPRWRLWATTARAGAPWLREACENPARDLVAWTRRGGAPRSLLVVLVGSVALVVLTGLLIVVFFVVAAATNAIAVSVVVSMAAAGGFLAVLLAFLAAIYIGALSVAVFVISVTTIATAIAITIATGWVAFFWFVWFTARECLILATKRRTGTINP